MSTKMQKIKNTERLSFGRTQHVLDYPDFLDIQLESFEKFVQLDIAPNERKNQGLQTFQFRTPVRLISWNFSTTM